MFVLLEHATRDGRHWDFLIEMESREELASWRLAGNPLAAVAPIPAEAIPDHRRLYLDYEGPISGERGQVRRLDRGPAEILIERVGCLRVSLSGHALRGEFEIRSIGDLSFFKAV